VDLVRGPVEWEVFTKEYSQIFSDIANKVHLTQGYIEYRKEISKGYVIGFKSLTSQEDDLATQLQQLLQENDVLKWRIILALTMLGSESFNPKLDIPTRVYTDTQDQWDHKLLTWAQNDQIQGRVKVLNDMPSVLLNYVSEAYANFTIAFQQAILDDVNDPFVIT